MSREYTLIMKHYLLLFFLLPCLALAANESTLLPPDDPRQSIAYWKAHTISAEEDAIVGVAENIFRQLLRAWDNSRVEPGLYVVHSNGAAWAASLADGNILLSREAIDASFKFGQERGEHLLAFVLAHELAHQRSDDLWHQRFFRSLRSQDQENRDLMLNGLPLQAETIADIEKKEIQADHDGLIMMSTVGFDPWQVLTDRDFFTAWVESIWQATCDSSSAQNFKPACQQAKSRALRTRSQLDAVASQAAVYDLGIQAMVANDYEQARHYFTLFGREYPNRNIMSAIGISYLSEAISLRKELITLGAIDQVDFYFPLILDTSAGVPTQEPDQSQKRAAVSEQIKQLQLRLTAKLEAAAQFLQKAIQLDPDHRVSYLSLAMVHIIENNPFLVRGVLQGRYLPRFGEDAPVGILLAMVDALQGNEKAAEEGLKKVVSGSAFSQVDNALSQDVINYTAVYNLAALYHQQGRSKTAQDLWQKLAQTEKSKGNALLFRLALKNLVGPTDTSQQALSRAPSVKGVRLGDKKPRDDSPHHVSELWIEGEQYHLYVYEDGARYISASSGKIISARQVGGLASIAGLVEIGGGSDRPLKTLGLPDRRLQLSSGEYIAYDDYRLALHILNNRVQGWFLYR